VARDLFVRGVYTTGQLQICRAVGNRVGSGQYGGAECSTEARGDGT
jgi:hypothetical protein